ncbi:MAG: hypothetical protein BWY13_01017 [Euryarchaeota archaeon ADurb.Bin190]|nr:MAG: hypothetical protein BWY13_01017 [Euryarchaeota archaeon ADurb.Bin190]
MLGEGAIVFLISPQSCGYAVIYPLSLAVCQKVERAGEVGEVLLDVGKKVTASAVEYQYPIRESRHPSDFIINRSPEKLQIGMKAEPEQAHHHHEALGWRGANAKAG